MTVPSLVASGDARAIVILALLISYDNEVQSMEMKQLRQQLQVVDSDLKDSRFFDVDLSNASFTNVSLKCSSFNVVNLSGSTFADINMSNVSVTDSNLSGMTINGILVADLIQAYESRRGGQ